MPFGIVKHDPPPSGPEPRKGRVPKEEIEIPEAPNIRGNEPRKGRKPKEETEIPNDLDINEFILWLLTLNPNEYPIGRAIILRVQRHKRSGFVKDILELYKIFIREKRK